MFHAIFSCADINQSYLIVYVAYSQRLIGILTNLV